MDFIAPLEHWLVKINARLPKLPEKLTRMIAHSIWVLCAFSVVISAGSVYASLSMIETISHAGSQAIELYGITPNQARLNGGFAMVYFTIAAVLQGLAILPLKKRRLLGWRLLLLSTCIATIVSIATSVYPFAITAIVISIGLFIAVFYFLLQLHRHFEMPTQLTKPVKSTSPKTRSVKKKK